MRIKYKECYSHCNKEVGPDDIIKGYEYEKGKYVVMADDDLEKMKTRKDKTIHILHFAKLTEIDPIYYEDYYAIMDTGAEKAYGLLHQTLLSQKKWLSQRWSCERMRNFFSFPQIRKVYLPSLCTTMMRLLLY